MNIIKASAYLVTPSTLKEAQESLLSIEYAARHSHRNEDQTGLNTDRFIENVITRRGDWSVAEHVIARVAFTVDRGITHEIVRHRHFSYTQESTRFVNYDKKFDKDHLRAGQYVNSAKFIYPIPEVSCDRCLSGHEAVPVEQEVPFVWVHNVLVSDSPATGPVYMMEPCNYNPNWMTAVSNGETFYRELINPGSTPIATGGREVLTVQGEVSTAYHELATKWRAQEARSVLPNALASKLIMTGNLRAWRWFFLMRTTKEAHAQMREVTIPLLAQFQEMYPLLYSDIVPLSSQSQNSQLAS